METKIGNIQMDPRLQAVVLEEEKLALTDEGIKELQALNERRFRQMAFAKEHGHDHIRREIRNDIIVDNMRLVTAVLRKYGGISPDRFQDGCMGLIKAAEAFNVDRGVPFASYAAFCIEAEVRKAFRKAGQSVGGREGSVDSLDAKITSGDGDTISRHELIEDLDVAATFEQMVEESAVGTLVWDIIIPCVERYAGKVTKFDAVRWRELQVQYFMELAFEPSQRRRLNFTEMARQLGTTPQNIRARHKLLVEQIQQECARYGYILVKSPYGRVSIIHRPVRVKKDRYKIQGTYNFTF